MTSIRLRSVPFVFTCALALGCTGAPSPSTNKSRASDAGAVGASAGHGTDELVVRGRSVSVVASASSTRIEVRGRSALTLGASRLRRGQGASDTAGAAAAETAHGTRRPVDGQTVEQVLVSDHAAEQRWRFDAEPRGTGDLVVHVPVLGSAPSGTDARGLRFGDGGREIVYSHATFVDADGERTELASTFASGGIEIVIPDSVLDGARYPAVLDPTVSAQMSFAGATAGSGFPAFGDQRGMSFSPFSSTSGLVVYVDEADPAGTTLDAVRIDQNGNVVGSVLRIATVASAVAPATACNATECLVVFESGGSLVSVRVSSAGTVLDATPRVLGPVGSPAHISVFDHGSGRVVAWSDRGTPTGTVFTVRARQVGTNGVPLGAAPVDLGTASGSADVSVAASNNQTVVVWDDLAGTGGRLRGARLDNAFALVDATPVTLLDSPTVVEHAPRVVRRSSDFVLVYAAGTSVWAGVLDTSPSFALGTVQSVSAIGGSTTRVRAMDVRSDGTNVDVFHCESDGVNWGNRSFTLGASLAAPSTWANFSRSTACDGVGIATMASGRLALASMVRSVSFDVDTAGYDVQARIGTTIRNVTRGAASTKLPAATYGPSQFALGMLTDEQFQNQRALAARVTTVGVALDTTPTILVSGLFDASNHQTLTYVAPTYVANQFLFVWNRYVQSTGFSTSTVREAVAIEAFGAPNPGILQTLTGVYTPFALLGGTTTATAISTSSSYAYRTEVTASGVGTSTFVSSVLNTTSARADAPVAILSSATALSIVTASNTPTVIASASTEDEGPSASRGATSTLVVRRAGPGGTATNVEGLLLNAAGSAVTKAAFVIHADTSLVGPARVAFDGTFYDVFFTRGDRLMMVRVDESGTVRDVVPSTIATGIYARRRAPAVAADGTGRVLVAYEVYDATPGVRALRVAARLIDWAGSGSGAADGTACSSVLDCASGYCIDGVCCDVACGYGVANDCQACSAAAGGTLPDGTCGPAQNTVVCRAAAGVCDVADTCTGTTTACSVDAKVAAGTVCGALSTQPCETDQMCDGVGNACPAKRPSQTGAVCRPADGECDAEERCNGVSTICPADVFADTSVVCRPAAGPCDEVDTCSGWSNTCPELDFYLGSSTVCRPANGPCDATETCSGLSVDCPADLAASAGTACRAAASDCDGVEVCDGGSFACPADAPAAPGITCRPPAGVCDLAEVCDGIAFTCPVDAVRPSTTTCRPAAGPCDAPERCTGAGPSCPPTDAFMPAGTTCRAAVGGCDAAEVCLGTSASCPANGFLAAGSICRPATDVCDAAEACSGSGASCPINRFLVDGTRCEDGLVCNGAETCVAGTCTAGEALVCAADAPCLESTGQCSVAVRPHGAAGCSVGLTTPTSPVSMAWLVGIVLGVGLRRRMARVALTFALAVIGGCVCGVGAVPCGDACVDVGYDERNCGACGVSCGAGQCIEGECVVATPPSDLPCDDDTVCIDGNPCNGTERCVDGACRAGVALVCDDGLACSVDSCRPDVGSCVSVPDSATCGVAP